MANDGWSNNWPSGPVFPQQLIEEAKFDEKEYINMYGTEINPVALGVNLKFDKTADAVMAKASDIPNNWLTHTLAADMSGVDWATHESLIAYGSDKTTIVKIENDTVTKIAELKSQGSNLVDSEAYLYFQCESCGEILDPHTKSFKTLQDKRTEAGWTCKWNVDGMGYKVYCVECG